MRLIGKQRLAGRADCLAIWRHFVVYFVAPRPLIHSFIHWQGGRGTGGGKSGAQLLQIILLFFSRSRFVSAFAPGLSARTFVRSLCYFGCYFRSGINLPCRGRAAVFRVSAWPDCLLRTSLGSSRAGIDHRSLMWAHTHPHTHTL